MTPTPLPRIVPAGTQVVSRLAVHGSHDAVIHPRGAVGVVTRTPVGGEINYTIRFPDGFEAALPIEQFEVLKHFKDRLGSPEAGPDFNLESLLIFRCITGSQAYGLETDDSDVDRRGVYLAPAALEWSLYGAPEQFEDNTSQSCFWELQKFLVLALKANPNVLECLYSPLVELVTPLGQELLALRARFLLANYLGAMTAGEHPAGDTFEAVRGQLIAAVREEILLSSVGYFLAADQPASQALTARAPLCRWYARTLVLDHPGHMSLVSSDQLEKWGVTFEEAFAVGLQTLRECTIPRFKEDNGVYAGTWNDDYDSTRILVPGVFDDLPIEGDPIVVLPNRLTLLVADSANHEAVRRMLGQAEEIVSKVPRSQNPAPLRVREGLVEDYVVGEDSPIFEAVQRAHSLAALTYYADQQQMLEKYYQKTGKDLFVATHNLRQHNDGRYVSHAVWTKDVPTLLPDADLIAFVDSDRPEGQRGLGFVPRTKVMAVMGEQMLDTKMFPRRDFVSGFPNVEQLKKLGIA